MSIKRDAASLICALCIVAGLSVFAIGRVRASTAQYDIDSTHSGIVFSWNHFGFSNPAARFDKIEGRLMIDKDDLTKSSISVVLPAESIDSGIKALDEQLEGPDLFDARTYPTIEFKSTKVERTGENGLKVNGELTIRGITKPVSLDARINKFGVFEIPGVIKAETAGFDATTTIKRSEFGLSRSLPAVGDAILVRITVDAKQAPVK